MDSHLAKLILCFEKCREFGINFNPQKCVFMVLSLMIMGFIESKKSKLPNLKKIQAIVSKQVPTNPQQI